jgi:hypothetical protein
MTVEMLEDSWRHANAIATAHVQLIGKLLLSATSVVELMHISARSVADAFHRLMLCKDSSAHRNIFHCILVSQALLVLH